MCTFNITLDDALLERVRPSFGSDDALQPSLCNYSDEEMYSIVKERLQRLKSGTAELIDGDECLAQIRTRYGIET